MTFGERIKKVRKEADLTQQEFGKHIGIKPNSISLIESGSRNASEQVILSICREFNVSEKWLRTGEGEMLIPKEEDALDELVKQYGLSDGDHILIAKFLKLKPAERQAVIAYMQDVVSALNAGTTSNALVQPGDKKPLTIDEEVELYRQQLLLEKEQAEKSSVSSNKPGAKMA